LSSRRCRRYIGAHRSRSKDHQRVEGVLFRTLRMKSMGRFNRLEQTECEDVQGDSENGVSALSRRKQGSSPLGSANLSKNLIFPTEDGVPVVSRETAPRVQPSAAAFRPVPFLSLSPTGIQRHSTHQSSNPPAPATHSASLETVAVCGKLPPASSAQPCWA
jgi:hypothetical protein